MQYRILQQRRSIRAYLPYNTIIIQIKPTQTISNIVYILLLLAPLQTIWIKSNVIYFTQKYRKKLAMMPNMAQNGPPKPLKMEP